ncbi:cell division protein FtsW [Bifidobacterium margollesii]|uniref:Probable peptidoglycan glycosyltransferase FtsW n=1 Tax=Bifidobacterium margollesii TaxID=2020964 RepID=A0A2N5JBJ0_9BIFI|nr:putative peptidoglycan glycosyltransferase FtsW [Bifidobacterium margollesii]PLS31574.1 cell division protein FtsW [Bifidobacterium margollesii]
MANSVQGGGRRDRLPEPLGKRPKSEKRFSLGALSPSRLLDKAVAVVTAGSSFSTNGDDQESNGPADYSGWRCVFNPLWCYYGFIISVGALTIFGLMMVFSSSSVDLVAEGSSPWSSLSNQTVYAIVGIVVAFFLSKLPVRFFRKFAAVLLAVAIVVQLMTMVPGIGASAGGNVGWIRIGPISFQPAEILKWTVCLWMPSAILSIRKMKLPTPKAWAVPVGIFLLAFASVIAGKDLGTAMIVVIIGGTALLVGGLPLPWFFGLGGLGVVGVLLLFVGGNSNRMNRILAAYGTCTAEQTKGVCYQSIHGAYAMASGGLTGVGLGNSREKWNYLPEAHNDFIFAIIGEELGFLGALAVILGFVVLGWCLINIAMHHQDAYARMVLMCFVVWIVGQAIVNIAVVVGLLPVMGLPMPFVSAGGTAMVMCLVAAGTAVSMARSQTEIKAALARA